MALTVAVASASASGDQVQVRVKRQLDFSGSNGNEIQGSAIDFSQAVLDPETGKRCVIKEEEVESLEKEPVLECNHREVEKCHYTYITQFTPAQEEVCEESFEKTCQITFKQQAVKEMVKKCYRPLVKVCNGQGKEVCQTMYESSCTTRYVEKQPGKFVGDTRCEKVPIEVCGAGCVTEEGPEECHDKDITSLIDVPEEICDLNPQKSCRLQTKLVPSLMPKHECTIVPQEVCNLRFTAPKLVKKPLMSKWCLDEDSDVQASNQVARERVKPGDLAGDGKRTSPRRKPNRRPPPSAPSTRRSNDRRPGSRRKNPPARPSSLGAAGRLGPSRSRLGNSFSSGDGDNSNISYDDTFAPGFGQLGVRGGGDLSASASSSVYSEIRPMPDKLMAPPSSHFHDHPFIAPMATRAV